MEISKRIIQGTLPMDHLHYSFDSDLDTANGLSKGNSPLSFITQSSTGLSPELVLVLSSIPTTFYIQKNVEQLKPNELISYISFKLSVLSLRLFRVS